MKGFETPLDGSLGMIELKTGQKVKITVKDGKKVLEKVQTTIEEIAELIPLGQKILNSIISIFNNISFELPCVLIIKGSEYIKTEQIARGSAVDKVWYQSEVDLDGNGAAITSVRKYQIEAPTIAQARSMMRKELRADNWI